MKILIHALGACMGGALRHLTNFLPELGNIDVKNEYVVLIRESMQQIVTPENIRFHRVPDKDATSLKSRINGDLIRLPINLKKENYNGIVSLTNFGPIWTSVPHILFQRNPIYFCNYYLKSLKGKEKFEVILRRFWAVESMKRAEIIITPSNAMANSIIQIYPDLKSKTFQTIYHGNDNHSLNSVPDDKHIELLSGSGLKFLYPTHPAPHKGFEILFKILFHLKEKLTNFKLFVPISESDAPKILAKYEKMISDMKIENFVEFFGRVPQDQMGYLYQNCDLMIYPSLCESFGFSMIEAMGLGLPIVASKTPVNQELCGSGALYYDPLDSQSGAQRIIEALKPSTKGNLITSGQLRYKNYDWSWNRCATEFVNLINNANL